MMYAELMRKKCNGCGSEKEIAQFSLKRGKPNSRCKECIGAYMKKLYLANRPREMKKRNDWYAKNRESVKAKIKKYYSDNKERIQIKNCCRRRGITTDAYFKMVKDQDGKCANCKEPNHNDKRLAIDHCHITGNVRSLLCDNCNTALGLLKECPRRIQGLVDYIAKHQK